MINAGRVFKVDYLIIVDNQSSLWDKIIIGKSLQPIVEV